MYPVLWQAVTRSSVMVWRYHDQADFERMWALVRTSADPSDRLIGDQLVIWAETPEDPTISPANTSELLSPFAWAVCARARFGDVRIVVIDLNPRRHASACLRDVVELLGSGKVTWLSLFDAQDVLIKGPGSLFASPDPPSTRDPGLEVLREHLRLRLTDPGTESDRHATANVIGPLLLLGNRQTPKSSHRDALRALIECAGLWPASEVQDAPGHPVVASPLDSIVRVLLVDDYWHHGWAAWVASCLGLKFEELTPESMPESPVRVAAGPGLELWVTASGDWLLHRLQDLTQERCDQRLCLSLLESKGPEILLLDLRLFPPGSAAESRHTAGVIALCGHIRERLRNPPWPTFTDAELGVAAAWSQGKESGEGLARSLLGRAMALVDPTYPIVLFSTTGRRDLVAPFEPYENIICTFEKPRHFSADQSTARTLGGLTESLRIAREALVGRASLASTVAAGPAEDLPPSNADDQHERYGHVALYCDESGISRRPGDLVFGAILAFFRDREHEYEFDAALKEAGIHWAEGGLKKGSHTNAADSEAVWIRVGTVAKAQVVTLGGLVLWAPEEPLGFSPGAARAFARLDNLHRAMLRTITEIALFTVACRVPGIESFTFSVLADIRALPMPPDDEDKDEFRRFGLSRPIPLTEKVAVLDPHTVLPIVDPLFEASQERKGGDRVELYGARGIFLNEGKHSAFQEPSLLFLADWVAHFARESRRERKPRAAWLRELLGVGFGGPFDDTLNEALSTVRDLEEGRRYEGLRRLAIRSRIIGTLGAEAKRLDDHLISATEVALAQSGGEVLWKACLEGGRGSMNIGSPALHDDARLRLLLAEMPQRRISGRVFRVFDQEAACLVRRGEEDFRVSRWNDLGDVETPAKDMKVYLALDQAGLAVASAAYRPTGGNLFAGLKAISGIVVRIESTSRSYWIEASDPWNGVIAYSPAQRTGIQPGMQVTFDVVKEQNWVLAAVNVRPV